MLRKGDVAVYERATRTIRCVECRPDAPQQAAPEIDAGVAGASAQREYERRRDARHARLRQRFGQRLGGVIVAVTNEPQSTRAWERGAAGEERVAKLLAGIDGVHVLNDRQMPGSRANIDHLVVSAAGVFIVDAKYYKGMIRIRDRGGLLRADRRLYVGRHDCSELADGLTAQVEAVRSALVAAGIDPLTLITPVLCFVEGEWPLLFPPSEFRGVRLEGPRSLRRRLTASCVLDEAKMDELTRALVAKLPPKH